MKLFKSTQRKIWIHVWIFIKANFTLMHAQLLPIFIKILQLEEIDFFWKFYRLFKKRCMYLAFPVPKKNTYPMCPIILLLFIKGHDKNKLPLAAFAFLLKQWLSSCITFYTTHESLRGLQTFNLICGNKRACNWFWYFFTNHSAAERTSILSPPQTTHWSKFLIHAPKSTY